MSNPLALLTAGLASAFAPAPRPGPSPGPVGDAAPANLQMMVPSALWNWPVDPLGTSSQALYEFCSWMPVSASISQEYAVSPYRFSDSYKRFLQTIPNTPAVNVALAQLAASANQTLVQYQNGPQCMPTWIVDGNPPAFLASVAGQSGMGQTIRIELKTASDLQHTGQPSLLAGIARGAAAAARPITFSQGQVTYVDIYADAWGTIAIRPAGWYDGTTIKLWSSQLSDPERQIFFGSGGILCCLLTNMYVGLNVSVTVEAAPPVVQQIVANADKKNLVRVAGFTFDPQKLAIAAPAGGGNEQTIHFPAAAAVTPAAAPVGSSTPLIVGVSAVALG